MLESNSARYDPVVGEKQSDPTSKDGTASPSAVGNPVIRDSHEHKSQRMGAKSVAFVLQHAEIPHRQKVMTTPDTPRLCLNLSASI